MFAHDCSTLTLEIHSNTKIEEIKNKFIEQFDFKASEIQIQGNETTLTEYLTKVTTWTQTYLAAFRGLEVVQGEWKHQGNVWTNKLRNNLQSLTVRKYKQWTIAPLSDARRKHCESNSVKKLG